MAEDLRYVLNSLELVDKSLAIVDERESIVIPLRGRPDAHLLSQYGARLVEREFPARNARTDPIDEIRSRAPVPSSLEHLLPERWEKFGDVVVMKLPPELVQFEQRIGEAYADVLGAKAVLREVGGISGEFRTPHTKRMFGSEAVTVHKENGILYKFDAERIMFSSGNEEERLRMATIRCDGEVVVDMFSGIGYFSLPLAVYQRPTKVVACEINPIAHSYLSENIRLNRVESVVSPFLGDNRDLPGTGFADRVIMGYVKTTHEFLPAALRYLKSGGTMHYHETCPNELLDSRPIQRVESAARGYKVELLRSKAIKSYAPGVSHIVLDVKVLRPA